MPNLVISVDDCQEKQIADAINSRSDFIVAGATITDSDGKQVFLKNIYFQFLPDDFYSRGGLRMPIIIGRSGQLDLK